MSNRILKFLPALLLLLPGCILAGGGSTAAVQDLEASRTRWNALDWENYDMRIRRMCYCVGAGEYDVMVRNDSVVYAQSVEEQEYRLDPAWWNEVFPTVDGLIDMAERAQREAGSVEIAWDANGWPTTLSIDWITQAIDDEMYFAVESVTQAPEGEVADIARGATADLMGLGIRFDGIESDSRCAADVQCIWAGEAKARLHVTAPGSQPADLVLSDRPGEENVVHVGSVTLRLLLVTPYPQQAGVEIPADSYVVRILAERS